MRGSTSLLCLAAFASLVVPLHAQTQPDPPQHLNAQQQAVADAWAAARKSAIPGPTKIKLLDQGELSIPAGYVFIPAAEANRIMQTLGNSTSSARFGLIISRKGQDDWMVDVGWIKEGYVRDDDAKDWKPDALLASIKENTEHDNAGREARGLPALDVVGWAQPPVYDAGTHRLVWSLLLKDHGSPDNEPQTVNYNTYALGRDGYFMLDLITDSQHIAADKAVAGQLLGSLNYTGGKRYQDFNRNTDKVAEYGLAALVGVVAVKKLGLLALAGAFLIKVWKLGLLAIAGGAAAVRKFFRRNDSDGGMAA